MMSEIIKNSTTNRRPISIFENEYKTADQVAYLAKEDIIQRRRAVCIAG